MPEPGEITLRAFLSGKLDLTRAEAVHAVIESGSRDELKQALKQLAGGMAVRCKSCATICSICSPMSKPVSISPTRTFVSSSRKRCCGASPRLCAGHIAGQTTGAARPGRSRFRVVLTGRPNAGKSSLFNALAGADALVSPQPGTTRDYLLHRLDLDDIRIELIDTPGRQAASDTIETSARHWPASRPSRRICCCCVWRQVILWRRKKRRCAADRIRRSFLSAPNAISQRLLRRCWRPAPSREPASIRCVRPVGRTNSPSQAAGARAKSESLSASC